MTFSENSFEKSTTFSYTLQKEKIQNLFLYLMETTFYEKEPF